MRAEQRKLFQIASVCSFSISKFCIVIIPSFSSLNRIHFGCMVPSVSVTQHTCAGILISNFEFFLFSPIPFFRSIPQIRTKTTILSFMQVFIAKMYIYDIINKKKGDLKCLIQDLLSARFVAEM